MPTERRIVEWSVSQRGLVDATDRVLRHLVSMIASEHRRGGILAVVAADAVFHHSVYGEVPIAKLEKYQRLSLEKARRLALTSASGHRASFESRDESKERLGGAILAGSLILSFSGLTEEADSALGIAVARDLRLLSSEEALHLGRLAQCTRLLDDIPSISQTSPELGAGG